MPNPKSPISFVLLDGSVLTNGLRVLIDGVDTTQFEKNPVMLLQHDDWNLPVGRWINIRKESGKILADAEFDYDDTDTNVQRMIGKVERGFLKMASSGLVELVASDDTIYQIDGQSGPTIIRCRLREASIVAIGGNHNALRLYDPDGVEIDLSKDSGQLKLRDLIQKPIINMNKTILSVLNLADGASMDAQISAVETLISDKAKAEGRASTAELALADFKKKETEAKKAEAVSLVDIAIKDGRINAEAKESYLKLFDVDFESAKTSLASITSRKSVREQIQGSQEGGSVELTDLEKKSWDELDREGKLLMLKDKHHDLFVSKFEARFGKKPE